MPKHYGKKEKKQKSMSKGFANMPQEVVMKE